MFSYRRPRCCLRHHYGNSSGSGDDDNVKEGLPPTPSPSSPSSPTERHTHTHPTPLILAPFNATHEQNDYEIPWSLRDIIADERLAFYWSLFSGCPWVFWTGLGGVGGVGVSCRWALICCRRRKLWARRTLDRGS